MVSKVDKKPKKKTLASETKKSQRIAKTVVQSSGKSKLGNKIAKAAARSGLKAQKTANKEFDKKLKKKVG